MCEKLCDPGLSLVLSRCNSASLQDYWRNWYPPESYRYLEPHCTQGYIPGMSGELEVFSGKTLQLINPSKPHLCNVGIIEAHHMRSLSQPLTDQIDLSILARHDSSIHRKTRLGGNFVWKSLSLYYFVARRWWSPKGETFVSATVSFPCTQARSHVSQIAQSIRKKQSRSKKKKRKRKRKKRKETKQKKKRPAQFVKKDDPPENAELMQRVIAEVRMQWCTLLRFPSLRRWCSRQASDRDRPCAALRISLNLVVGSSIVQDLRLLPTLLLSIWRSPSIFLFLSVFLADKSCFKSCQSTRACQATRNC